MTGEVSLELIFELLKDMQRHLVDVRSELKADIASLRSEFALLRADNMAFRGYLDGLAHDGYRAALTQEKHRVSIEELGARIEKIERGLETL